MGREYGVAASTHVIIKNGFFTHHDIWLGSWCRVERSFDHESNENDLCPGVTFMWVGDSGIVGYKFVAICLLTETRIF